MKILYTVILFFVCCITATTSIADNGAQVSANIEKENETIGISVEKVENTEGIIKCRYCGRLLKNGNIHRDALTIIQKQVEQGLGHPLGVDVNRGKLSIRLEPYGYASGVNI